jgi:PadR family transcriptional regulator, regulatory protein PadR
MGDQHIPLRSVELHILLSVVDRPRHGYAILQEAEERTDGRPGFEIPTLYRALRRLREADLIRLADPLEPDPGERREYWEATKLGRRALEAELTRLEVAVAVGRARMGSTSALRATVGKQARAGGGK